MVAGFEIRPATPEEAPTLALINRIAFNDVATWNLLMTDVDPDDVTKLFLAIAAKRMADGNVTYVSTVDKETGTILGATAVYVPIKEKDTALNPEMPAGVNEKLAAHVFGEILQETRKYGYDPEKHCHRVGAFILPEYQRKGLGSALSRECDVIADEVGVDIYVSAYESSLKMFENAGFVRLGHVDTKFGEYGGPNTSFRTHFLKRYAPATAS
ncbi:hypothetical protein NQ176_g2200 [Zarea fungicola]|uniref:Uncharacterized protein n=1 Tax=Zarea fungicola TaxID=93591 RepID=A0ACC1NPF3_9HYPO|nr:hypothetical protein NQ176_g2200 [Lecanicillium fungicola]